VKILNVTDDYNYGVLAANGARMITAVGTLAVLAQISPQRGAPQFVGLSFDRQANPGLELLCGGRSEDRCRVAEG
jgi:hypothetical protein